MLYPFEARTLPSVTPKFSPVFFKQLQCGIFVALLSVLLMAWSVGAMPLGALMLLCLCLLPLLTRLIALDFQYHILANIYLIPLGVIGVGYACFLGQPHALASAVGVLGGLLGGLLIHGVLGVLSGYKAGLGGGDIKFLAAAGAWLGIGLLPVVLWLALGIMLPLVLWQQRQKHKQELPFGPALIGAFWLTLLFKITATGLILDLLVLI